MSYSQPEVMPLGHYSPLVLRYAGDLTASAVYPQVCCCSLRSVAQRRIKTLSLIFCASLPPTQKYLHTITRRIILFRKLWMVSFPKYAFLHRLDDLYCLDVPPSRSPTATVIIILKFLFHNNSPPHIFNRQVIN